MSEAEYKVDLNIFLSPFHRWCSCCTNYCHIYLLQERMRAVLSIASKLYCLLSCFLKVTQNAEKIEIIFFTKIKKSHSSSICQCDRLDVLFLLSSNNRGMDYSELFFVSVQMDISCVLAASLISLLMLEFGMKQQLAPTVVWKYRVPSQPETWVRG